MRLQLSDRWFKRIAQSDREDRNLIVLNKPTGLAVHRQWRQLA